MEWDVGLQGLGVLLVMSLGFGMVAQLAFWRATTRWIGLLVAAVHFVSGIFISEVWFGWATAADLQPNYDGLAFDEVLLIGLVPVVLTVLVVWYLSRSHRVHRPMSS